LIDRWKVSTPILRGEAMRAESRTAGDVPTAVTA
jgi:hypothetical protein